jgi:hypothetical protein
MAIENPLHCVIEQLVSHLDDGRSLEVIYGSVPRRAGDGQVVEL